MARIGDTLLHGTTGEPPGLLLCCRTRAGPRSPLCTNSGAPRHFAHLGVQMNEAELVHKLQGLQAMLLQADRREDNSFSLVADEFCEIFSHPDAMALSTSSTNKEVIQRLQTYVCSLAPREPVHVLALIMLEVPRARFTHGVFYVRGRQFHFFHFAESDLGLIASSRGDGYTEIVRLRVLPTQDLREGQFAAGPAGLH